MTLEQNFHASIESDLAAIYPHLNGNSISKIKQLLIFIGNSVPFIPNWNKIANALEVGDIRTLKTYFQHLEDARLLKSISKASDKFSQVESVDKVYLDNTNQLFAISSSQPEKGTVRETFFLSMVTQKHRVRLPLDGDFLVSLDSAGDKHSQEQFLFEVGGKKKTFEQVKAYQHAFLACDDIEIGVGNKIPLWLFGFLY